MICSLLKPISTSTIGGLVFRDLTIVGHLQTGQLGSLISNYHEENQLLWWTDKQDMTKKMWKSVKCPSKTNKHLVSLSMTER